MNKPNIVYILTDDMGYGDATCLNPDSRIPTPHLDALAQRGMIFLDAHSNSAVCTPTRYGILTGRYAWRGRLQSGVLYGYSPPLIEDGRLTVASYLRGRGYRTACIGKWHLGLGWQPAATDPRGMEPPADLRFDLPLTGGAHTAGFGYSFLLPSSLDIAPYCYIENGRVVDPPRHQIEASPRPAFWRAGWCSDSLQHETCLWDFTRKAIECIDNHARAGDGRPLFLYLALPSPHTPHCPRPEFKGRSGAGDYGDLMVETDWTVGQVVDALKRNGMLDGTLLIFTSDNGCDMRGIPEGCGHRGNHVYRGQKSDAWDGGHRIPFIASWLGHVPAGSVCDRTICLTDLLATCASILGHTLPDDAGEDSFDILPLLRGEAMADRPAVVHHSMEGRFAIRDGRWKLILCRGSGGWSLSEKDAPPSPDGQLYDMAADPSEQRNLYVERPDVVGRLTGLLEEFRRAGRSVPRHSGSSVRTV